MSADLHLHALAPPCTQGGETSLGAVRSFLIASMGLPLFTVSW